MRQTQVQPSRRIWSVPLRRALVSLAVIAVLFVGSTRLVQAASTTLPGDNLYPVKRTWEDVRILFTFDMQAREALEVEHENERLEELNDLFEVGRSAKVDFAGTVMSQNGDLWEVAKIPVLISTQSALGAQPVKVGDPVRVRGYTQPGGTVMAERVDLLPTGMPLPEMDDDHGPVSEQEKPAGEQHQQTPGGDDPGKGMEDEAPMQDATNSSQVESKSHDFSRSGSIDSLNGNTLVVNGQSMNISDAKIEGKLKVGSKVKVEGYFNDNGVFVVTKIEVENGGSDSGGDSVNNNGSEDNGGSDDGNDSGSHEDGGGDDHQEDDSHSSEGGG
jgi:hypothetical protein